MAVGVSRLAREVGYTQQYVSLLMKQGLDHDQIRERANLRRAGGMSALQGRAMGSKLHEPRPSAADKEGAPQGPLAADGHRSDALRDSRTGETLQMVTLRKAVASADQTEMENAVRRGELVRVDHIENFLAGAIIAIRDRLLRLPEEMKDDLSVESDPVRIEQAMQKPIREALEELEVVFKTMAEQAGDAEDVGAEDAGAEGAEAGAGDAGVVPVAVALEPQGHGGALKRSKKMEAGEEKAGDAREVAVEEGAATKVQEPVSGLRKLKRRV